jgi:anti-sigma28 factor (negative regulator of flagellin synthesis)
MRQKESKQSAQTQGQDGKTSRREADFLRLSEAAGDDLTHIDLRAEKIRMLKEQVRDGTYAPDLKRVALILVHDEGEALVDS